MGRPYSFVVGQMRRIFCWRALASIFVVATFASIVIAPKRNVRAQALEGSVTETKAGIANMPHLVTGFAYVAGGAAMLSGAGMLKRNADNPQQNPLAPGQSLGGVVAAMPSFLEYVNNSLRTKDGRAEVTRTLNDLGVPIDSHPILADPSANDTSASPPGGPPPNAPGTLIGPILQPKFIPQGKFTPIRVFFGTNRKFEAVRRKGARELASFGTEKGEQLEFGEALVTVPVVERSRSGREPRWAIQLRGFFGMEPDEDVTRDVTVLTSMVTTKRQTRDSTSQVIEYGDRFRDQALVFLHGFNVTFDEAIKRAAQMAKDIEFDGPVFVYSWPSQGRELGYIADAERAKEATVYLNELIDSVLDGVAPDIRVHFIAHSMGSQTLLGALDEFRKRATTATSKRIGQVIMIAPDASHAYFSRVTRDVVRARLAQGITVYVSEHDRALQLSEVVAGGDLRAGRSGTEGPLLVDGVDTIDTSAANSDWLTLGHSDALDQRHLLGDISKLLETGIRPPDSRYKVFYDRVTTKDGVYWRYVR